MKVALVVACGPPGVGKTTVAEAAADHLGATLLRTDVVRKDLFTEPTYTDEEINRTYRELFDRAGGLLKSGESVVLDGTFRRQGQRGAAASLATERGATFRLLRVKCDPTVARRRIRERETDASDADVAVYEELRAEFEPIEREHTAIDNSGSRAASRRQVAVALG